MGGRTGLPAVVNGKPMPDDIVVWKFGGTSVGDVDRLRAVARRLVTAQRSGLRVVAVLSAMGHTTDALSARAYQVSGRPPLRELDALLSVGESISTALTAMAVHELGSRAVSLTGAQAGLYTDGGHGNARLRRVRPDRVRAALDDGAIVLVTGFQGVSQSGDVTTMGRGGSDASAVAVAAGLGLAECDIFTDVDGVFTADPRIVPNARKLDSLRHDEMLELAEAGAGVLQPRAVELAATRGVDIHLRSSFSTEPGTRIRRDARSEGGDFEPAEVTGVAHRRAEALFTVRDVSATAVVSALAARGASIGVVRVTDEEIEFSAPGVEPAEVTAALAALGGTVTARHDLGTVSVVSRGIARRPRIPAGVLAELDRAGIAARFVTTTPGRVSVHVASAQVDDAVRALHARFVPATATPITATLTPAQFMATTGEPVPARSADIVRAG